MQHFWAMVIQEKSDYILMLCNTVECKIQVHPMSDEDSFIRVSKIRLDYKDGGNEASRTVHHYHWENWPDRGVPPTKLTAIEDCQAMSELLKEIRTQRPCSIQNAYQYLYVHRVLLAYFLEKYKRRFQHCLDNGGEEKYQKWCADYKRITGCD
ncbi:Protein-tyrosine phosphatase [Ancylostoma ceylanicum]|uniref:Protein-tyrosine phosphatase n=1 Tax=Ancylostoma ceylanicum TaxID=53326 RepID=A0A0D6LXU2_9BILA|nr:Protein-tyrosine phosphatase [Ancylostoma ceylanicum]